jgi:hypothetical protein
MKEKEKYSRKDVAIVVPLHKTELNADEKLSIGRLKILKGYPRFLVIPKKLENEPFPEFIGFKRIIVENEFLSTYKGYNELLKTGEFYSRFKNFKYMLIYQVDCLALQDNLLKICDKDYDYVAAPIFRYNLRGNITKRFVGNGGLSLRKIGPAIKVMKSYEKPSKKLPWKIFHILMLPIKTLQYLLMKKPRSVSHLFTVNEDIFWSLEAKKFFPDFKVAPVKDACEFAIEREKEICLKLNNNKLPFGVHAFEKYNKSFWMRQLK